MKQLWLLIHWPEDSSEACNWFLRYACRLYRIYDHFASWDFGFICIFKLALKIRKSGYLQMLTTQLMELIRLLNHKKLLLVVSSTIILFCAIIHVSKLSYFLVVAIFPVLCSNATIPISSASSEDRRTRADIAASFQVTECVFVSVLILVWSDFEFLGLDSFFFYFFFTIRLFLMQRVAVLHLEERCERAIEWALNIEPSVKYLVCKLHFCQFCIL